MSPKLRTYGRHPDAVAKLRREQQRQKGRPLDHQQGSPDSAPQLNVLEGEDQLLAILRREFASKRRKLTALRAFLHARSINKAGIMPEWILLWIEQALRKYLRVNKSGAFSIARPDRLNRKRLSPSLDYLLGVRGQHGQHTDYQKALGDSEKAFYASVVRQIRTEQPNLTHKAACDEAARRFRPLKSSTIQKILKPSIRRTQ